MEQPMVNTLREGFKSSTCICVFFFIFTDVHQEFICTAWRPRHTWCSSWVEYSGTTKSVRVLAWLRGWVLSTLDKSNIWSKTFLRDHFHEWNSLITSDSTLVVQYGIQSRMILITLCRRPTVIIMYIFYTSNVIRRREHCKCFYKYSYTINLSKHPNRSDFVLHQLQTNACLKNCEKGWWRKSSDSHKHFYEILKKILDAI